MVTVTKGEREEYERQECNGERQSLAEKERKKDREDDSVEGSRKSARERKRGDDFRERGLRGPPRRGAESPSSSGAAARIFLPLSGPLSRPLFFFSPGHRRGARAAFHPHGPRRFFFSSVCAATPPRHNGRVPENSSLGRRPFPRPPRLFRRFPSRLNPLLAHRPRLPLPPARSPSYALFSLPFFVLAAPPPPPAAAVDVDPTIRRLCHSRVRRALQLWPQGCILRDPSNHPLPPLPRRATARYVRSVLYTILEARNVCARLWPGVYTAAV